MSTLEELRDNRRNRRNARTRFRGAVLGLVILVARAGGAGAEPLAPLGVRRTVHASRMSPDVRVGAVPHLDQRSTAAVSSGGGALVINATFDSSITSNPKAAAIEAMINRAIGVVQSLLNDRITVSIRFRYSTTYADGTTPLPDVDAAVSESVLYMVSWNTYLGALTADATTANDATANGTLPGSALTPHVDPSSANGRAVGLSTPPVMFADGSLGPGGPYDGIVTLNPLASFSFTRPLASGTLDAQRLTEHEIDEVLGLGSSINLHDDLRPQDLFSWSAAGVRNLTANGSRYLSIDAGTTDIVGFNQDPSGDFGDWLSDPCPQLTPYVQNAFSCLDQASDVTQISPEGINLDVIGYDLITGTIPSTTTTTTLPCSPPQVECCPAGQPGCGVCGNDCGNGGCCTATFPVCDNVNRACRACAPPEVECCPLGQPGCGACGTDCGDGACCPASEPVCDNANHRCLVQTPTGPQCSPGQVPCNDAALGFTDTACCSEATKKKQCAAACSQIIAECKASCANGSHAKKCKKRCQAAIVGHCRRVQPHACS